MKTRDTTQAFRVLGVIVVAIGLAACGASPIAPDRDLRPKTDILTWEFVNSMSSRIDLRFFDHSNGAWYPSRSQAYVLEAGDDTPYRLECNKGATVCYGASLHAISSFFWGQSVSGNQSCGTQGCCHVCDGSRMTAISLTR